MYFRHGLHGFHGYIYNVHTFKNRVNPCNPCLLKFIEYAPLSMRKAIQRHTKSTEQ